MVNISEWLNRKYAVEEQNARTQRLLGQANVANIQTQTALAPAEAQGRIAQEFGTAAGERGRGAYYGAEATAIPQRLPSEIGATAAQTAATRATTAGTWDPLDIGGPLGAGGIPSVSGGPSSPLQINTPGSGFDHFAHGTEDVSNPPDKYGLHRISADALAGIGGAPNRTVMAKPGDTSTNQSYQPPGGYETQGYAGGTENVPGYCMGSYAEGTSSIDASMGANKVPGQGDGTVDTVNAKLAPKEAVLNAHAAEYLGRDTIAFLNALGEHSMGMDGTSHNNAGVAGGMRGAVDMDHKGVGPDTTKATPGGQQEMPGYAMGDPYIVQKPMSPMPGQGGYWGPNGDTPPAPAIPPASTAPKPTPSITSGVSFGKRVGGPPGYAGGTSEVAGNQTPESRVPTYAKGTGEVGKDRPAGVRKNDMPYGSNKGEESTQGYAKGTKKVPGKGAAKGGGKGPPMGGGGAAPHPALTPGLFHALLQHAARGGAPGAIGMPPAGGAPLPMSMPMTAAGQNPMAGQTPMQMGGGATRLPMQGGGQ